LASLGHNIPKQNKYIKHAKMDILRDIVVTAHVFFLCSLQSVLLLAFVSQLVSVTYQHTHTHLCLSALCLSIIANWFSVPIYPIVIVFFLANSVLLTALPYFVFSLYLCFWIPCFCRTCSFGCCWIKVNKICLTSLACLLRVNLHLSPLVEATLTQCFGF